MTIINNIALTAERTTRDDWHSQGAIHWKVKLNDAVEVLYSEGIGHFVKSAWKKDFVHNRIERLILGESVRCHLSKAEIKKVVTDRVKVNKGVVEITPPKVDDVIYSLVVESDAIDYDFNEWCNNLGFDNDSTKARKTYNSCQESFTKLRKLGLDIDELREQFQNY